MPARLFADPSRRALLAVEFFWGMAMPFVFSSTVMPGYLHHLGVDNVWIGLAPALHNGALALVQPISAYAIPPGPRRLTQVRGIYWLGAACYVILGLLIMGGMRATVPAAIAALLTVVLFSTATGIGDPHYIDCAVAASPVDLRGRFFGLRMVFLGLGGVTGAPVAERVLQTLPAPLNFGLAFLMGGLIYGVSVACLLFYRSSLAVRTVPPREGLRRYFVHHLGPQVRNPPFRAYLVSIVLFASAICAFPFLGPLLHERLSESDRIYGVIGALFMGSTVILSFGLGYVADRSGPRNAMALAVLSYGVGVLGCLLLRDRLPLYTAYALASVWLAALQVPVMEMGLRLARERGGPGSSPADVMATIMVSMAPVRILGPLIVGRGLDLWSYAAVLPVCVGLAAAALFSLAWVRGAAPRGYPPACEARGRPSQAG